MALQSWTTNGWTSTSGWSWRQIVEDVSYNIETNTSVVTVYTQIKGSYFGGTPTVTINCEGQTASSSPTFNYPTYVTDWTNIYSHSFTIEHASDGSRTIGVSTSWSASGFVPTNCGASGTYQLTTIPRATKAPDVLCDVESSVSFTISPYTNFSHSIYITLPPNNTKVYLKVDGTTSTTEVKYEPTVKTWLFIANKSYYNLFNKKTLSIPMIITTYSGDNSIGTSTGTITISANANLCSPVISGTAKDTNTTTKALTGNENTIIKYKSVVQLDTTIQITAPNDNNATLSYLYVAGNQITTLSQRSFTINNPLSKTFLLKAINSRDFATETPISATGNFIEYIIPTVTITNLKRTEPTTGDITLSYKGDYFNGKFSSTNSNTLNLTWKYREKGSTDWTTGGTLTPTIKDNTFTGETTITSLFDYRKQYDIILIATDKLSTIESSISQLPRGYPIFWWGEDFVDILGELRINGINPFQAFVFSEEETIVGKWIDGKTLYQKVIKLTDELSPDVVNSFPHYIDNVDFIFVKLAVISNGDMGYTLPVGLYRENQHEDPLGVYASKNNIQFLTQTGWGTIWTKYVVLNYTKTTDTGNS